MSLLNNDWKDQIGKEDILWSGDVDDKCTLFYSILGGFTIGGFTVIGIIAFLFSIEAKVSSFMPIAALLILISMIYMLYTLKAYRFVITNKGCYTFSGIFFKKQSFVDFRKITNVILKKGPIENMIFGLGTVHLDTASSGVGRHGNKIYECSFHHIKDFKKVRDLIQDKI